MTPSPFRITALAALALLTAAAAYAQAVADFEAFALPPEGFLNGSALDTAAFDAGPVLLPNDYDPEFESWSGWSISNVVDTVDPSFENYGAFPGTGAESTETYAIGFGGTTIHLANPGQVVEGLHVANATYAALVVRDGNQFSKQFGGATGEDPDYFAVSFRGWSGGQPGADSLTVDLADYRFDDGADDYILDEWTYLDLSPLGPVDSLSLSFTSTDVGDFGINTPTYVCIDQVTVQSPTATREPLAPTPVIAPNPVADVLTLGVDEPSDYAVTDARGRLVAAGTTTGEVAVAQLRPGLYALHLVDASGRHTAAARFLRADR